MSIDGGQLIAISLIGVALASGIGLFYLGVLLLKRTWTGIVGSRPRSQRQEELKPPQELNLGSPHAAPITAADLYVIRSNLDAVSRQVEDLERKLRLSETHGSNIINLKRK